jgi:hypothetical protein
MADALKVSDNVKIYRGDGGLKLSLVLVQPLETKKALVEVTGSDTFFDKLVRLHDREETGRGYAFHAQVKGREWYTLRVESSQWSGEQFIVWLPGRRDGAPVSYDAEASEKASSEDLLNRHLRQAQEGLLAKISEFSREERLGEQKGGLDEVVKETNKVCGTNLEVGIDWKTLSDKDLRDRSVSSYLGSPLNALQRLVSNDGAFYTPRIRERVKRLTAQLGPRTTLTLANGEIKFATNWEASNLQDFAFYVTMNELNK